MSNPTPILNNINAFDATEGTTISFNIIGGTDIVRSNIVYIYDLGTNDLICTHLYISTESIHELPPNTDPSIVYASGKSSADFVNNKNYYLQIQTFTNTAGTAGGSGMSVAKTFWCLFNPALSVNAIPAAISTTSYNVGATYTTNITDVTIPVTNIIQQYKFDLYTATGTLAQTSGNIIGSGEQEGTSTTYNITYNFSGLVVNNSYYVVVTTTSTEGVTVSAQSNTFAVSIETPTVGAATATNNSCDGYISVVSNLSSEYGGSASGEMASFETDSVNNVSSLKVNMEPIQDLHGYDAPWVGGAGKNLLNANLGAGTINALTYTNTNGIIVVNGTASANTYRTVGKFTPQNGVQYIMSGCPSGGANSKWRMTLVGYGYDYGSGYTFTGDGQEHTISCDVYTGAGLVTDLTFKPMIRLASETDATYEPYENICPISGHTEVDVVRTGKNLLKTNDDLSWIPSLTKNADGTIRVVGSRTANGAYTIGSVDLKANTTYTLRKSGSSDLYFQMIVDGTAVTVAGINDGTYTPTADVTATIRIFARADITYDTVLYPQLELGSTATAYEPYQGQTYTTPLGQTVYGGTVDLVSGLLTVDKAMVDLGTLTWTRNTSDYNYAYFYSDGISNFSRNTLICSGYPYVSGGKASLTSDNSIALYSSTSIRIAIRDDTYTDATSLKTSLNGIQCVYYLATPLTYQLTPQQIQTLVGVNNVWSDAGNVEVTFNLPITNLLVKRQDTSDTSGKWLTLYSQPITQASDMDFTYIDFLNQHGKTYRYALVPLLTQQQGDVDVEIEGGYTVSDDVLSVFDGVFIANSNGSQKLKAATEYGDLETNQDVGVLTTIGGKYPFVVSNSNLNYHSGSISALIVPSDFYTDGDLDRLDIVERREAIEQFLTDKTAKILKDWNGNIWLITFIDNVEVSFVDDYGMGLGTLSAKWVEIGDVNDQTDLQQTGLI